MPSRELLAALIAFGYILPAPVAPLPPGVEISSSDLPSALRVLQGDASAGDCSDDNDDSDGDDSGSLTAVESDDDRDDESTAGHPSWQLRTPHTRLENSNLFVPYDYTTVVGTDSSSPWPTALANRLRTFEDILDRMDDDVYASEDGADDCPLPVDASDLAHRQERKARPNPSWRDPVAPGPLEDYLSFQDARGSPANDLVQRSDTKLDSTCGTRGSPHDCQNEAKI